MTMNEKATRRPNLEDLCYTIFMYVREGKNPDDGGPVDWCNDTRPMALKLIADLPIVASHSALVDALEALRVQWDLPRLHLLGHSLGGMVALACVTAGGLCFAWWHPEHTLWHFFVVTQLIPLFYLGLSWWTASRPATESDHA